MADPRRPPRRRFRSPIVTGGGKFGRASRASYGRSTADACLGGQDTGPPLARPRGGGARPAASGPWRSPSAPAARGVRSVRRLRDEADCIAPAAVIRPPCGVGATGPSPRVTPGRVSRSLPYATLGRSPAPRRNRGAAHAVPSKPLRSIAWRRPALSSAVRFRIAMELPRPPDDAIEESGKPLLAAPLPDLGPRRRYHANTGAIGGLYAGDRRFECFAQERTLFLSKRIDCARCPGRRGMEAHAVPFRDEVGHDIAQLSAMNLPASSKPTARRPVAAAQSTAEPVPQNGSRTRPSGGDELSIRGLIRSAGNVAE